MSRPGTPRAGPITRLLIDYQGILHGGYEAGVGLRRDNPLLLEMRLKRVF